MSGKFTNHNQNGHKTTKSGSRLKYRNPWLWVAVIMAALVLIVLIIYFTSLKNQEASDPSNSQQQGGTNDSVAGNPYDDVEIDILEDLSFNMIQGLRVTDVGSYTGIYMEDGTDEIVSRVLMIVVTNTGNQDLQYAEIQLTGEAGEANFSVSTLPAGASAVLLERERMKYPEKGGFNVAVANNVTFFPESMSLCEDQLKIQSFEGAINVTNISGKDIVGDIIIYYKNSSPDMYYGGITYRVRIEGGLKAGEIRQLVPSHFNANGSTILLVTCGS